MIRSRLTVPATIAIFAPFVLAACGEARPTGPAPQLLLDRSTTDRPRLAYCPTGETLTATARIGPEGGSVAAGGHRIDVPAGAIATPTRVTLRVPAGDVLRVDITAGSARTYRFRVPARVTISYDRCPRQRRLLAAADAWYVDPATGLPVERMDARVDQRRKTVMFVTEHLSTYVVFY